MSLFTFVSWVYLQLLGIFLASRVWLIFMIVGTGAWAIQLFQIFSEVLLKLSYIYVMAECVERVDALCLVFLVSFSALSTSRWFLPIFLVCLFMLVAIAIFSLSLFPAARFLDNPVALQVLFELDFHLRCFVFRDTPLEYFYLLMIKYVAK